MDHALLDSVDSPHDLRALDPTRLPQLAEELRDFVLQSVARTGGHLSSNLGTIELTIALHYVFDTPRDRLVWDVGHQTYAHKILTGRRAQMATLRQTDGISGFPRREESAYDTFGTAHASTSISAALGMALAARQKGEDRKVVAVIGDGALTAGMAFEALNNAGVERGTRLLVILNDNDMSIDAPVGALHRYLGRLKDGHRIGEARSATLFDDFGFDYHGPVDGHDLNALVGALTRLRAALTADARPQFLHVKTRKGRGYKLAEADPVGYHGARRFDPAIGMVKAAHAKATFSQVFGRWLCDMAEHDARLVGITPAMCEGSGLTEFQQRFPGRYYDVAIAEQHAVTFAAGLACEGLKPVVAIYSTFLQRAYDQLVHDVAIQDLPVVFALDRAGVVGGDGATHNGAFDISFLRCVPNVALACPPDERECRQLLTTAFDQDHPVAVRYPRGAGVGVAPLPDLSGLPYGRGEVRREGRGVAILAFGTLLYPALAAAERLGATVVNMRWVKPLDHALLLRIARTHAVLVTVEEGAIMGGAGSAVGEALAAAGVEKPLLQLGLRDHFVPHGDPTVLLAREGLDAAGIEAAIRARFAAQMGPAAVAQPSAAH